jgi:lipopolysaccharide/colanic/teichoic acid biosynthesis glycosyltransferase
VACDVLYARNKSLRTDLKIIVATLPAVTSGRGSY